MRWLNSYFHYTTLNVTVHSSLLVLLILNYHLESVNKLTLYQPMQP